MKDDIYLSIPREAVSTVKRYLSLWKTDIKIVSKRKTKHGDYRRKLNGKHQITINQSDNPFRFLITLIHELAHFVAFEQYKYRIKPHGKEWKMIFRELMLPLINPSVFPENLLRIVAQHFKNPKASSDTDFNLVMELGKYDTITNKTYIFELKEGTLFFASGREFKLGKKRVKRFECEEVSSSKKYTFSPHAEVIIKNDG